MTIRNFYIGEIKKQLRHYYPAWLPKTRYEVGDIGMLQDRCFVPLGTSLKKMGIDFTVREDPDVGGMFQLESDSGFEWTSKVAGEANSALPTIPEAKAGLGLHFSKKGAFLVRAESTSEPSLEDIPTIQKRVIELFKEGRWDKTWVVITQLVQAPYASIIVSQSKDASLELTAQGDLPAANISDLGRAELGFSVTRQKGSLLQLVGEKNITPFFRLGQIKCRPFGEPAFRMFKATTPVTPKDMMDVVTPHLARTNEEVARSLHFDYLTDVEPEVEPVTEHEFATVTHFE